ncbi:MAG TPA: DUF4351 domain-containing protein [Bryobacteraceae bacterium]|nr:DUF4351 domain-containing protein [Bryobacteraceae bacterium]
MPILDDIMDHAVLGREIKKGIALGWEREFGMIRKMIQKRFGPLPAWADARLKSKTPDEVEDIALRLLDASSLEELLA